MGFCIAHAILYRSCDFEVRISEILLSRKEQEKVVLLQGITLIVVSELNCHMIFQEVCICYISGIIFVTATY